MMALRPPVVDRLLAAAAFLLGVAIALTLEMVDVDERTVDLWAIVLLGAMSAPLVVRRRWPIPSSSRSLPCVDAVPPPRLPT